MEASSRRELGNLSRNPFAARLAHKREALGQNLGRVLLEFLLELLHGGHQRLERRLDKAGIGFPLLGRGLVGAEEGDRAEQAHEQRAAQRLAGGLEEARELIAAEL